MIIIIVVINEDISPLLNTLCACLWSQETVAHHEISPVKYDVLVA
jgi:hypothetical protein